ncbi:acyl-CoA thioesterase [Brevibacillus sp. 179-C9.3 HS]|uniref:acyl-CoA thioesterase n=1 Tax=unclassified Brevibacillus TaxID=2684853 RepID=UPI0039A12FC5
MTSTSFELHVTADVVRAGHVNNVKYLEFLDMAREPWYHYFRSVGIIPFIANLNASYKREAFLDDRLFIETMLASVGNSSFVLKHTITNQHQELVLEAEATLVAMCLETREKIRVPDEMREQVQR